MKYSTLQTEDKGNVGRLSQGVTSGPLRVNWVIRLPGSTTITGTVFHGMHNNDNMARIMQPRALVVRYLGQTFTK